MEKLIKLQYNDKLNMEKFMINYGKDGKDRRTKPYYEARITNFEKYWIAFQNRDKEIALLVQEDSMEIEKYFLDDVYSNVENFYINSYAKIVTEFQRDFPTAKIVDSAGEENNVKVINIRPKHDDVKLPKISLPVFSGDYLSWSTFYDLFKSLVHENEQLSPVQKLQYLKTHLAGEAKSLLSNTTITSANYEPAWNTLITRYDNKRVLVKAQLDVLFNQPNVSQESAKGVKGLLDKTSECLVAMQNLGINIETWDPILVYIVTQRLPYETLTLWEQSLSSQRELPKWSELTEFLEARFRTLEAVTQKRRNPPRENKPPTQIEKSWKRPQGFHVASSSPCLICRDLHAIRKCPKYLGLNHDGRLEIAKSKGLCLNCLGTGHLIANCPSKTKCLICRKAHHTTLHKNSNSSLNQRINNVGSADTPEQSFTITRSNEVPAEPTSLYINQGIKPRRVLLATALVKVVAPHGLEQICRALIDPGSQASFVTEQLAQSLGLFKRSIDTTVSGLGGTSTGRIKSCINLTVTPINSTMANEIHTQAFVLKKITNTLPAFSISSVDWRHLEGLDLADPNFNKPGNIDVLLGADVYSVLICDGIRKGEPGTPFGQRTIFGWIITGETSAKTSSTSDLKNFHVSVSPYDDLRLFWELEEVPAKSIHTMEEIECEQHFSRTYARCTDGRYQVRLPFTKSDPELGASRNIAIARLIQMERRFREDPCLKREYMNCIKEYLDLGHMQQTNTTEADFIRHIDDKNARFKCAYLPHHAVMKPSSTTTKVRIVFDASRKTSNGESLNDILLKGPTIQNTLFSILLRWRKYKVAFMADVQKMYRQIRLHPEDTEFQRIVWRDSPNMPLKDYKLTTVTFGVKSAPYLAIRTMNQLAKDERHNYPIGADVILNDFYVDDLISGGNNLQEAALKQYQTARILESGGFELRKWASNSEAILETIPEENREVNIPLFVNSADVKALGMIWNPQQDTLSYGIQIANTSRNWTKRSILSEIAKLFDPIGWLAPVIVTAKLFIQALWIEGLDWDEKVPAEIETQWIQYRNNLQAVQRIQIPRWIHTEEESLSIELHGFCDASLRAYAAAVYVRVENQKGQIVVRLVSAKTKVAPIKTISLPRLELCGASLLSKLLIEVKKNLQLKTSRIHAWTDSTIVLAWLKKHPSNWETFIANRVSTIHQLLEENCWSHVPTETNPADCASRGVEPEKLNTNTLWWNGPWLRKSKEYWPRNKEVVSTTLGLRKKVLSLLVDALPQHWDLLEKFSSLSKLIRVTAYIQRWVENARSSPRTRKFKYLSSEELQQASIFWLRTIQSVSFTSEIKALQEGKSISRQSKLLKLNPFLHNDGLLRVGGRLRNASLTFNERHPIILPEKNHLTLLIIDSIHKTTMHGGSQLMLSLLRRRYWILNARNAVRSYNHRCISCFRQRAQTRTQLMGDLPEYRIQKARPFAHTGIDYCGPFDLKGSKGRSTRSYKGYIAVFICMVIKAIHLEIVSDLSSAGFLAAFRRFTSRRGLCSDVYSDCGSNFIGANAILTRYKFQSARQLEHEIAQAIENEGVKWHFIPPSSPHFGGLWESGVKSVKSHLKRIVGNSTLTYEEFSTLLTQIEASLNSRPLTEMTQDPDDVSTLTPGHFLIGGALLTPPEPSLLESNINHLDRYQFVQRLYQTFWNRWSTEYLHRLQQRPKWLSKEVNVKENDLVIVKDERLPPSRWLLGRVIKTHPGADQLTRVVTLKTQHNIIKRPITKICLLPINTTTQSI